MKFPMPREYKYIRPVDHVWYGDPDFKKEQIVPEIILQYGSILSKIKSMPFYIKYLIGAFRELFRTVKSIRENPYTGNRKMTADELKELEMLARSYGISGIGYTTINSHHMFQNSIVLFKNAIVFTMKMEKSEIRKAPSIQTNKEVFRTYYELGRAVNRISDYLREKGYNAQAIPAISSNLNLNVLARDAGLGSFGKHGLIISRENGPSIRLAAVLTDIETLPVHGDSGKNWIKNFCDSCNACVRKCPARAIYEKPLLLEDGSEQHIDYSKCAVPFSKQYGCTVCIKECTFFKTDYGKIEKSFVKK